MSTQQNLPDVMVDLETLGTKADAVIMSIGAVRFNRNTNDIDDHAFYASISIESNLDVGRTIEEGTLIWWLGQDADARRVFTEAKTTLGEGLETFTDWIEAGDSNVRIWSCGADFDIPMLAHAYAQFKLDAPWKFWNTGCYRTMKNLPIAKSAAVPLRVAHHNAMADAHYQARHLQNIFKALSA